MPHIPSLTIATATYQAVTKGRLDLLRQCVDSVASQAPWAEHLICDGGSQDGSVEQLKSWAKEKQQLKVASEPDQGLYEALNKALSRAQGEWFLVLGDDDGLCDGAALENALREGEKKGADAISTPVEVGPQKYVFPRMHLILSGMPCPHQGMLVKTSVLRALGGFDRRYAISADYDFLLKFVLSSYRLIVFHQIFARYSFGTGLSSNELLLERNVADILAHHFNLGSSGADFRYQYRVLPIRTALKLLFHKKRLIRYSAMRQVAKRLYVVFKKP